MHFSKKVKIYWCRMVMDSKRFRCRLDIGYRKKKKRASVDTGCLLIAAFRSPISDLQTWTSQNLFLTFSFFLPGWMSCCSLFPVVADEAVSVIGIRLLSYFLRSNGNRINTQCWHDEINTTRVPPAAIRNKFSVSCPNQGLLNHTSFRKILL
jgi:hypothetical protein